MNKPKNFLTFYRIDELDYTKTFAVDYMRIPPTLINLYKKGKISYGEIEIVLGEMFEAWIDHEGLRCISHLYCWDDDLDMEQVKPLKKMKLKIFKTKIRVENFRTVKDKVLVAELTIDKELVYKLGTNELTEEEFEGKLEEQFNNWCANHGVNTSYGDYWWTYV